MKKLLSLIADLLSGGVISNLRVEVASLSQQVQSHPAIAARTLLQDENTRLRDRLTEVERMLDDSHSRELEIQREFTDWLARRSGGTAVHDKQADLAQLQAANGAQQQSHLPTFPRSAMDRKRMATRTFAQDLSKIPGYQPPPRFSDVPLAEAPPIAIPDLTQ